MCLRTEREYARLAVVVCVCVVEHTDTLRASTDDTRVAVPARRVSSHLGSSRARGSRAPSCASRERVVLVWRVALHLGDNTPRSSNFEKPSKGGSANSRSQCPMQHAYPSALTAVLWLSAGCRLGCLDQPRRLPSRDQVDVASCQSSAQWPRSQARLSPNLRSPRSSST